MAAKKPAKKNSRTPVTGFTDEEREAMREAIRERKGLARPGAAEGEAAVLAKIAVMQQPDRGMAERLHALVKANAPTLTPRTWYGMPAYSKDGQVVCFFQPSQKFKTRYSTLGFSDEANLDDGRMWPTTFALAELTAAEEARIAMLLKKAVG
jgi:uncharacterized protein YdhG (YjbR/CyaY superfamily)